MAIPNASDILSDKRKRIPRITKETDQDHAKRSMQYTHIPCEEIAVLQQDVHLIKTEVSPSLSDLQTNQEDIKETLVVMNGSLDRIFYLYKKADKRLDINDARLEDIKIYMAKKDATNGHTEKETEDNKRELDELNRTRQPILNDIIELKNTKADKDDVNKVFVVVTEISTTLKDHCDYEEKIEKKVKEDLDERHAEHDRWYNNRVNQLVIVLAIIGIIIGFFQVQGGWHL